MPPYKPITRQEASLLAVLADLKAALDALETVTVVPSGTQDVNIVTAGLSTSANQATANTSLAALSSVQGAAADAAVTSDVNGTLSAKLRGLVKILTSVWDSTNSWL